MRNLYYEQLEKELEAKREILNPKEKERTIIIIAKTDSEEPLKYISKDIMSELSCCYNSIDVELIDEVYDWYEYI